MEIREWTLSIGDFDPDGCVFFLLNHPNSVRFQVLHACGQIDILCDALGHFSPDKYNQQERLMSSVAGELVVRHQKIIAFSDKVEKIFCYIALMQFISSTLVTCCLGYMVVTVSNRSRRSTMHDVYYQRIL